MKFHDTDIFSRTYPLHNVEASCNTNKLSQTIHHKGVDLNSGQLQIFTEHKKPASRPHKGTHTPPQNNTNWQQYKQRIQSAGYGN
jgi:hypothetical protein